MRTKLKEEEKENEREDLASRYADASIVAFEFAKVMPIILALENIEGAQ